MGRLARRKGRSFAVLAALASTIPWASAQSCIPLAGSTQCLAFNASSINTQDSTLQGQYPFLQFVGSREEFDTRLADFVQSEYVRIKYQNILGCSNITLDNTTSYYARYTTSVICNAIVQSSIQACNLAPEDARPLCADSCAIQATSEEEIVVNMDLCGTPGDNFVDGIRADFTTCALPSDSLSGNCVSASDNEPAECGFSTNLLGLCGYCAASSPNATDSCCIASDTEGRCQGVELPTIPNMPPLFPNSTGTDGSDSTAAPEASGNGGGLSGGAIAGIVIGVLLGVALIAGLIFWACILLRRRRRGSQQGSVFNQPSPRRTGEPTMVHAPQQEHPIPGGRVARMAALEGESSDDRHGVNPILAAEGHRYGDTSESEAINDSPTRVRPDPTRRQGSLSSNSALNILGPGEELSPNNGNDYSSPGDVQSGQSEQLPFFKDYYSQDEIHPDDKVAVLWAYSPRATDEFELERGDMLRVVGIWDDGWATGIRINDRAEDYDDSKKVQRDSGVSSTTAKRDSLATQGEIKAFPLVCVCLPQHWRKTIEIDTSTDTTSPSNPSQGHPSFGNF